MSNDINGNLFPQYTFAYRVGSILARIYMRLQGRVRPNRHSRTNDGVAMHSDIRDFVQRRVHYFGIFEHGLTAVVRESVRPGDLVIDIGANVGYISLLAAKYTTRSGRVIAIEADPVIYATLIENAELNPDIELDARNIAVTEQPCRVTMKVNDPHNAGAASTIVDEDNAGVVDGRPLHAIVGDELKSAAFIKIDIEGAEGPALEAVLNSLPDSNPRLTMAIEVHEHTAHYLQQFKAAGFQLYALPNNYAIAYYLEHRFGRTPHSFEKIQVENYISGHYDYVLTRVSD